MLNLLKIKAMVELHLMNPARFHFPDQISIHASADEKCVIYAYPSNSAVVAEKTAEKEKIESEVAALTANLDDLKTQLKAKKAELKAATKELTKAENKKAAVEAKAAEEAKKGEAEDVLKKLLASGMTAEEILAKLQ